MRASASACGASLRNTRSPGEPSSGWVFSSWTAHPRGEGNEEYALSRNGVVWRDERCATTSIRPGPTARSSASRIQGKSGKLHEVDSLEVADRPPGRALDLSAWHQSLPGQRAVSSSSTTERERAKSIGLRRRERAPARDDGGGTVSPRRTFRTLGWGRSLAAEASALQKDRVRIYLVCGPEKQSPSQYGRGESTTRWREARIEATRRRDSCRKHYVHPLDVQHEALPRRATALGSARPRTQDLPRLRKRRLLEPCL
jgi:hypothetical protein